jgi:hypothetical protein
MLLHSLHKHTQTKQIPLSLRYQTELHVLVNWPVLNLEDKFNS